MYAWLIYDAASIQSLCLHTSSLSYMCSAGEVVNIRFLALLVSELKKVGEPTRPDAKDADAASEHDIFDACINHAFDYSENENTHGLSEVKKWVRLGVIVKFETT